MNARCDDNISHMEVGWDCFCDVLFSVFWKRVKRTHDGWIEGGETVVFPCFFSFGLFVRFHHADSLLFQGTGNGKERLWTLLLMITLRIMRADRAFFLLKCCFFAAARKNKPEKGGGGGGRDRGEDAQGGPGCVREGVWESSDTKRGREGVLELAGDGGGGGAAEGDDVVRVGRVDAEREAVCGLRGAVDLERGSSGAHDAVARIGDHGVLARKGKVRALDVEREAVAARLDERLLERPRRAERVEPRVRAPERRLRGDRTRPVARLRRLARRERPAREGRDVRVRPRAPALAPQHVHAHHRARRPGQHHPPSVVAHIRVRAPPRRGGTSSLRGVAVVTCLRGRDPRARVVRAAVRCAGAGNCACPRHERARGREEQQTPDERAPRVRVFAPLDPHRLWRAAPAACHPDWPPEPRDPRPLVVCPRLRPQGSQTRLPLCCTRRPISHIHRPQNVFS